MVICILLLVISYLRHVVREGLAAVENVHPPLRLLPVHGEVKLVGVLHGRLELERLHAIPLLAVVASSKHCDVRRGQVAGGGGGSCVQDTGEGLQRDATVPSPCLPSSRFVTRRHRLSMDRPTRLGARHNGQSSDYFYAATPVVQIQRRGSKVASTSAAAISVATVPIQTRDPGPPTWLVNTETKTDKREIHRGTRKPCSQDRGRFATAVCVSQYTTHQFLDDRRCCGRCVLACLIWTSFPLCCSISFHDQRSATIHKVNASPIRELVADWTQSSCGNR